MNTERRLKMKRKQKVKVNYIDIKKEKKSTNFLMMHDLDPNLTKSDVKKGKKFKEDE